MRIVFMGSPDFAVDSLAVLASLSEHQVVTVVTQPDRPKGRGKRVLMTPVKEKALNIGLPVLQPNRIKEEGFMEAMRELAPDIIVVAAFGQFLPQTLLDLPKYGCINVHASLLPKYRGAAPIHYAILHGEKESGVTIMQMDIGMDTGDMLVKKFVPISEEMTMGELHDRLKVEGANLLPQVLAGLEAGTIRPKTQDASEATYATLLKSDMEVLDWQRSAQELHNQVRAFNPWPGSYTVLPGGKKIKIWNTRIYATPVDAQKPGYVAEVTKEGFVVATGNGYLEVLEVQPESKKHMSAKVFSNGYGICKGEKFYE